MPTYRQLEADIFARAGVDNSRDFIALSPEHLRLYRWICEVKERTFYDLSERFDRDSSKEMCDLEMLDQSWYNTWIHRYVHMAHIESEPHLLDEPFV